MIIKYFKFMMGGLLLAGLIWFNLYRLTLPVVVENTTKSLLITENAVLPVTQAGRAKGLLNHNQLDPGQGMVLYPCQGIHMVGMKFPIDVVFLDHGYQVVYIIESIQPGQVGPLVKGATMAIELPAGTIKRTGTELGDMFALSGLGGSLIERRLSNDR